MQWLRGRRTDIGAEFSLMADTLGRMETLAGAAGESTLDTLAHRSGKVSSCGEDDRSKSWPLQLGGKYL